MKAGFARVRITPPLGTPMEGTPERDAKDGCRSVHDPLFVRALYLEHDGAAALLLACDLARLDRDTVERYRAAVAAEVRLEPDSILVNTSHTHTGPRVSRWYYREPAAAVLDEIETATVFAACQAHNTARPARLWAGETRSRLPLNRRRKEDDGTLVFAPNPAGPVCDALPVCLVRDLAGNPICVLFSVACHPSIVSGFSISADYPGVAAAALDEELGIEGAMFLQGCGGDANASVIGQGRTWFPGDWHDVRKAGLMVAREVSGTFAMGLFEVEPHIRCARVEMQWPMLPPPDPAEYQALLDQPLPADADEATLARRRWAEEQVARVRAGEALPDRVPVTLHGVQIGRRVRLIGFEGEPVAELGLLVRERYGDGVTFALGCTNGSRLVLPTSEMLYEGGREVTSYFEYHLPAPPAKGAEHVVNDALERLRNAGVN